MTLVQRIYFLGLFLREASRNEDCNAVPTLEGHNLYLFYQAVQINIQTVGWVARPLDPEAVFPKENESVEVFGLLSYGRGTVFRKENQSGVHKLFDRLVGFTSR